MTTIYRVQARVKPLQGENLKITFVLMESTSKETSKAKIKTQVATKNHIIHLIISFPQQDKVFQE